MCSITKKAHSSVSNAASGQSESQNLACDELHHQLAFVDEKKCIRALNHPACGIYQLKHSGISV